MIMRMIIQRSIIHFQRDGHAWDTQCTVLYNTYIHGDTMREGNGFVCNGSKKFNPVLSEDTLLPGHPTMSCSSVRWKEYDTPMLSINPALLRLLHTLTDSGTVTPIISGIIVGGFFQSERTVNVVVGVVVVVVEEEDQCPGLFTTVICRDEHVDLWHCHRRREKSMMQQGQNIPLLLLVYILTDPGGRSVVFSREDRLDVVTQISRNSFQKRTVSI